MTTFTKSQLKAMQDAGVPVQWFCDGQWHDGKGWGISDNCVDRLRPQPGFTFSGTIPRKLLDAGINIERDEGRWVPVKGMVDHHATWTYRIADSCEPISNTAGRPICLRDLVSDLEAERDALKAQVAELKSRLEAIKEEATIGS